MPSLKQPPNDSVVLVTPGSSRYYLRALSPHLQLVFAVITVLGAILLLNFRSRRSQTRAVSPRPQLSDIKKQPGNLSLENLRSGTCGKSGLEVQYVWTEDRGQLHIGAGPRSGNQLSHGARAAGPLPVNVLPTPFGSFNKFPRMDSNEGKLGEDHQFPSAPAASRAVSTTDPGQSDGPYPCPSSTVRIIRRTGPGSSPRPLSRASSVKRHSGSSDGTDSPASKGKGRGPMAGDGDGIDGFQTLSLYGRPETTSTQFGDSQAHSQSSRNAPFPSLDFTTPRRFSRPSRPPPLTPPAPLAATGYPFEDRCPSYAVSVAPELDSSFIHQPNPEYSGCSTSTDIPSSSPQSPSAPIPRRRSYTKSVPIGITAPATTSASSSPETVTSRGSSTFFPSSYPPTSPLLPPPPPISENDNEPRPFLPPSAPPNYQFVGGPGGPGVFLSQQEIDLQGEIISVVDGAGHGWKRHTRVYGGGVCLACVAASGRDGEQGGFYGDKVPLEDRR